MQKWEYLLVTCTPRANTISAVTGPRPTPGATLATYLQQIGQDGWELAGTTAESDGVAVLLFKRPFGPDYVERLFASLRSVFGGGGFGPKPVEAGKEYNVQITETSRKGDGIARIQGFVIFVKDGKVGQQAKIKIINVGERFATAEAVTTPATTQPQEPTQQ